MKRIAPFAVLVALVALSPFAAASAPDGAGSCAPGCCAKAAGVERTAETIDNGVKITITAQDATAIAAIQERTESCRPGGCKSCPMGAEGVTRSVEKTANGVVITATASDPELVQRLQSHNPGMARTGHGHGHKAGMAGCCSKGAEAKAETSGCCAKGAGAKAGCGAHGEGAPAQS
jgi:hypothetical protein